MSDVKSPDSVLLDGSAGLLRFAHRTLGVSPLTVQFYPFFVAIALCCAFFGYFSLTMDTGRDANLALTAITGWFCISYWKDHASLRKDAKSEWTIALYRKYEALSSIRRDRLVWLRMFMLLYALFISIVVYSGTTLDLMPLTKWQIGVPPLIVWGLLFYMYCKSAELPLPGGGDFFRSGKLSSAT